MNKLEVRIRLYFTGETISQKVDVEQQRLSRRVKLVTQSITAFFYFSRALHTSSLLPERMEKQTHLSHTHVLPSVLHSQTISASVSHPVSLFPYQSNLSTESDSTHPFLFAALLQSSSSGAHPPHPWAGVRCINNRLNFVILIIWVVGSFKHFSSRQERRGLCGVIDKCFTGKQHLGLSNSDARWSVLIVFSPIVKALTSCSILTTCSQP